MPKIVTDVLDIISAGLEYDLIRYAVGSLVMATVGATIGRYTKWLDSLTEAVFVGIGFFILVFVLIYMIAPRAQSAQLAGNVEYVISGPINDNKDTILVMTVDVLNSGSVQSIIKNVTVTATIGNINYQGAFLVPPPKTFTFNDPAPNPGAATAVVYKGEDSLLEKGSVPVPPGGETKGVLFVLFPAIDSVLFKGASYTLRYEDAFSKSYTIHAATSVQKSPIISSSGLHSELICPAPPPSPPMSVATPPKT
jgi:hypothetical protein